MSSGYQNRTDCSCDTGSFQQNSYDMVRPLAECADILDPAFLRQGMRLRETGGTSAYILGISAYYHDSAAALLRNGDILAAAQEERFTRKKHDPQFPKNAIEYCLAEGESRSRTSTTSSSTTSRW